MTNAERFTKWRNSRVGQQAIYDTRHGLGELAIETAFLAAAPPDDVMEAMAKALADAQVLLRQYTRGKVEYPALDAYNRWKQENDAD